MDIAKKEVHMLLGVSGEINKMGVKLGDLKNFLADAERRNINDLSVQEWLRELQETMYEATNILDLCQLKAMEVGPSKDMGCFSPLLLCMQNPLHAHDIGSRIKDLNTRLDGIKERSAAFNFINLGSYEDHSRNMASSLPGIRETSGELNKLGLVGEKIEEDMRNLVEILTKEDENHLEYNNILVFAIVGVGGIGKTTLAQKIFNNDIIEQEFTKKIWLSVNQDFNGPELLKRITAEAGGDPHAVGNAKTALERTLKEALDGCKTLLVMDDVWNHQAWECVLKTPLFNSLARGSRVLVTTRHDMVARGMRAEEPYHRVKKLEPGDAWSLLKKQIVGKESDELEIETLKDIGMGIIEKCDCLPLAVKVMGGLLRQKKRSRGDWVKVLNHSIWSVSEMPEELNYAIYLSYKDLCPPLKQCFQHYSLLPKGIVLYADAIVGMWISKGFVHGDSCELEELGREYYDELISRNLIEPDMSYMDQFVCNMHDVVRSFAHHVAREEVLVAHGREMGITSKLNSKRFLRLSLYHEGSETNDLEWSCLRVHASLRTLLLFGHIKVKPGDSLVTFSSLRTLYLGSLNCDELIKSLHQLKHLRYLSMDGCSISILPESIGKMKFLLYVFIANNIILLKLPHSIIELRQLRSLDLSATIVSNIPRGFCLLNNLRKLKGFPAHMDGEWCSLQELGPLSHLIYLGIVGLENVPGSLFAKKARLSEKVCLTYLRLWCTSRIGDDGQLVKGEGVFEEEQLQIEEVFNELCPPSCVMDLEIKGYFGRQLPTWMASTSLVVLKSLRFLSIQDLVSCIELPGGLCQLPCLEFLQIDQAPAIKRVGPEFLQPDCHEQLRNQENLGSIVELVVLQSPNLESIANLPKLLKLTICGCPQMKVLEGMPALQRLWLEDYNMETLPQYLKDVNPKHLLIDCDVSLLISIAAGEASPEWDKFNHIHLVKAYADDDDDDIARKWYVLYTRDSSSFKTNTSACAYASADKKE